MLEKGRHLCFVFNFHFNKSKTIPKIKHTKQVKGDASLGKTREEYGGRGRKEERKGMWRTTCEILLCNFG